MGNDRNGGSPSIGLRPVLRIHLSDPLGERHLRSPLTQGDNMSKKTAEEESKTCLLVLRSIRAKANTEKRALSPDERQEISWWTDRLQRMDRLQLILG